MDKHDAKKPGTDTTDQMKTTRLFAFVKETKNYTSKELFRYKMDSEKFFENRNALHTLMTVKKDLGDLTESQSIQSGFVRTSIDDKIKIGYSILFRLIT